MTPLSKNLFAVEFRNVPGKGLFASGGLKFKTDEATLRRQCAPLLDRVSIHTLLGEASLWVLWPSTAAIWVFPFLVWRLSIDWAILASIGVFLAVLVLNMLFYSRRLNYGVLVLGNRALQGVAYAGFAVAFWRTGMPVKIVALAAWLLLMALGVVQVIFVIPFVPLLKRVFARSPADQALRNVARHHARRAGIRPPALDERD